MECWVTRDLGPTCVSCHSASGVEVRINSEELMGFAKVNVIGWLTKPNLVELFVGTEEINLGLKTGLKKEKIRVPRARTARAVRNFLEVRNCLNIR